MSVAKYTPGPWVVSYDGTGLPDSAKRNPETGEVYVEPARIWGNGILVAHLRCQQPGPWTKELQEREANARLIAAAPELLAACKAARSLISKIYGKVGDEGHPFIQKLDAAIAKAEGHPTKPPHDSWQTP